MNVSSGRNLGQAHLLVFPFDEQNKWFRYHTLFADLLRFQLEHTQPQRIKESRRKAALWPEQNGFNISALEMENCLPNRSPVIAMAYLGLAEGIDAADGWESAC